MIESIEPLLRFAGPHSSARANLVNSEFKWCHILRLVDRAGIMTTIRCYGPQTADVMRRQFLEQGFWRVEVIPQRKQRNKNRSAHASHGSVHGLNIGSTDRY